MNQNNRLTADGKKAATGHPLLLGITKASLSTDSFISAAVDGPVTSPKRRRRGGRPCDRRL